MTTQTVTLSVEVPMANLTPEGVEAAVIQAAVDRLFGIVAAMDYDEDGDPVYRRDETIFQGMRDQAAKLTRERILSAVDSRIPPLVDEVLNGTFQPTSSYGEKRGEVTTIRELIMKRATDWLNEVVDNRGNASGYGDNRAPRIRWMVNELVESNFKAHLVTEVTKATAEVKAGLVGRVSAEITKTVSALLKLS